MPPQTTAGEPPLEHHMHAFQRVPAIAMRKTSMAGSRSIRIRARPIEQRQTVNANLMKQYIGGQIGALLVANIKRRPSSVLWPTRIGVCDD
jgi:hypothetical protein